MHSSNQLLGVLIPFMLVLTNCLEWNTDRLYDFSKNGNDIEGDCVGSGVYTGRIATFYSLTGCANACPYLFNGSGSHAGDHFGVFNAFGFFNSSCGSFQCGQLIAYGEDNYYRTYTFLNSTDCANNCNSVCGK